MRSFVSLLFLLGAVLCQENDPVEIACGDDRPANVYIDSQSAGLLYQLGYNRTHGKYEPNMLCDWRITSLDGTPIEIMMLDLDIEYCTMCRCDGVRFWEWGLPLEPEDAIGNFCGIDVDIPDPFTAQGSHVYARFFSDDMYEYRGFLARFGFSIESSACTPDRPDVITRHQGVFVTPNWPDNYPNNALCHWHLLAPEGHRIRIQFFEFQLESSCNLYDYVTVFDGNSTQARGLGTWAGQPNTLPPILETRGNSAFIEFDSDSSIVYSGFIAGWEFFEDEEI